MSNLKDDLASLSIRREGAPSKRRRWLLMLILILGEAAFLGLLGGGLGILLGREMIRALPSLPFIGDAVRGFPGLGISPQVAAIGLTIAILLALAAGVVPALMSYRARIADMLRQV